MLAPTPGLRWNALALSFLLFTSTLGCSPDPADRPAESTEAWHTYRSAELGFQIQYPPDWRVYQGTTDRVPVVSFYDDSVWQEPPQSQHASETRAYVVVLPQGLGTEGVFGETEEVALSSKEELNREASKSYRLQNGEPWAWFLMFRNPPRAWNDFGFVWAGAGIEHPLSRCLRNGSEVPLESCDPFTGDRIVRTGAVSPERRDTIEHMLGTLEFLRHEDARESSKDIRLEEPRPGQRVRAPFRVRGEAKGTWFFEGVFPIRLIDAGGKVLASEQAKALSSWMTEELVLFEAELSYPDGVSGEATLKLERANPSGRTDMQESLEIPLALE